MVRSRIRPVITRIDAHHAIAGGTTQRIPNEPNAPATARQLWRLNLMGQLRLEAAGAVDGPVAAECAANPVYASNLQEPRNYRERRRAKVEDLLKQESPEGLSSDAAMHDG